MARARRVVLCLAFLGLIGVAGPSGASAYTGATAVDYDPEGDELYAFTVTWKDWWDWDVSASCMVWDPEYGCVRYIAWERSVAVVGELHAPSQMYGPYYVWAWNWAAISGSFYGPEGGLWWALGHHYIVEDTYIYDYDYWCCWWPTYLGRDHHYFGWTYDGQTVPVAGAQVTVTRADIENDVIEVVLQGAIGGDLSILLDGNMSWLAHMLPAVTSGTYTMSFRPNDIPEGSYTQVRAVWTPGVTVSNTRPVQFRALGLYRHSQYNTPHESACTGGPTSAFFEFAPQGGCAFWLGSLKSDFANQVRLNGSGLGEQQGPLQLPWGCLPFGEYSFRPVSQISGSHGPVNTSTVAVRPGHPHLTWGNRVLIVGVGIKTITDTCPACSETQLDNYSASVACSSNAVGDLGFFKTIRLN
jgi:hypothetical protein